LRLRIGSLAFGADLRYGQRRTTPGGFIRGKTSSAISGDPDIPYFLLLDDPANELFLSAGLGADRILSPAAQTTPLSDLLQHCVKSPISVRQRAYLFVLIFGKPFKEKQHPAVKQEIAEHPRRVFGRYYIDDRHEYSDNRPEHRWDYRFHDRDHQDYHDHR
jgi:hypothetical protein